MNDLQFGDFCLDLSRRELRCGPETLALPGKAFDLLVYMAANPGRVLPKSELLAAVWPDAFVEESNLTQNVFLLRKALGADSPILTVPGRGYQFTAPVTNLAAVSPTVVTMPQVAQFEATHSRIVYQEETENRIAIWRSPLAMTFVVAAVVLLVGTGWLGWQRWEDHVGGPPVQVVLADLDGGTGDPVLDRSLVDAMRFDLAQSPFVTVVPAAIVRQTLTQMMHKPDDPLTATLARDLCERTGSQAVLHGSVARVGEHFLLNEEATNCVDGTTMTVGKQEARNREELPRSIDKLAETLRHGVGESRRTIARYSAPLVSVNTGSIEALEDFTQGNNLSQRGKTTDAIGLLKQAVELDPNFAAAYLGLANLYSNLGDHANERVYVLKAYELRDTAATPTRLYIVARYHTSVTGDLFESLRNYQAWVAVYPRNLAAWAGLLEMYRLLGRHAEAIDAANHAIAINPHYVSVYYGLALEQMHAGNLAGARSTCELALSRGLDGEAIHLVLLRVAYLRHDVPLFDQQVAWASTHPESSHVLLNEAQFALLDGRTADAHALLDRMTETLQQQGLAALADTYRQNMARLYAELGNIDEGRRLLHVVAIDPDQGEQLVALAETGDASTATAMLRDDMAKQPQATLWNSVYAPEIRAVVALQAHKPNEAIAALEGSRVFESSTLDLTVLRGRAYLDAGRLGEAEAEFRKVLAHPEIDPVSSAVPVAKLGLGRTLEREGKSADGS
jgi:DNA-binding winged helix-turn-helix (wHTH) protein/tetratricopeptide (TPR) repeat protein